MVSVKVLSYQRVLSFFRNYFSYIVTVSVVAVEEVRRAQHVSQVELLRAVPFGEKERHTCHCVLFSCWDFNKWAYIGEIQYNFAFCVGQSYDGAAAMASEQSGVTFQYFETVVL